MKNRNLQMDALRHLVIVSEEGTFQAAALKTNITQSAISQQLQNLETDIGVKIFEREGRRKVITKVGHEVVRVARDIIIANDYLVALGQIKAINKDPE